MIKRYAVAGTLAALTVLSTVGSAAGSATAAAPRPVVTGFQGAWSSPALIDRDAHALTTVGVDGVSLAADGASVGGQSPGAIDQRMRAHRDRLRAELVVSNYSDAINDFSEKSAYRMLSIAGHRSAVIRALVADVRVRHWDGISLDLESLAARDTAGLTTFVRQLRNALPRGASLSICVQAFTHRADYRANGYDLAAIAGQVGRVILMAYDQHGPWENTPGPVGALGWQRGALAALLVYVPRAKVDLGVAGYGYAWRPHSNDTLSDADARRLAGSRARFDATAGEWTAQLADGSTLWWADARSYRLRVAMAARWHLHGLAVWDLELSDPLS